MSVFASERARRVVEKWGPIEWTTDKGKMRLLFRNDGWLTQEVKGQDDWCMVSEGMIAEFPLDAIGEKWLREKLAERKVFVDGAPWGDGQPDMAYWVMQYADRGAECLGGDGWVKAARWGPTHEAVAFGTFAEGLLSAAEACIAEEEKKA